MMLIFLFMIRVSVCGFIICLMGGLLIVAILCSRYVDQSSFGGLVV